MLKNFVSSFEYDKILAKYDIESNIAYLKSLSEKNIVTKKKVNVIISELKNLKDNLSKLISGEDVHYSVEKTLEKILTKKGKSKNLEGVIRTARSRNDLVVSDERLYF